MLKCDSPTGGDGSLSCQGSSAPDRLQNRARRVERAAGSVLHRRLTKSDAALAHLGQRAALAGAAGETSGRLRLTAMANTTPKTPPSAWVRAAREALVEEGIQGVKIDRLAQRLGVTKGGFYKHFSDRAELLARLLELWVRENLFLPPDLKPATSSAARDALVALTDRLIDEQDFDPRFDMAVRDWARVDAAAERTVARIDRQRLAHLARLFSALGCDPDEAEVRARVLYYHQVGYYALGVKESRAARKALLPLYMRILVGAERFDRG
jgi:AcrR family transcriptional regulator